MTLKKAYFAGGCFWGTEHFFKHVYGVLATRVGYINSHVNSPSYRQVCTGLTGAAEGVEVTYDADLANLDFLIRMYLTTIDPTSVDRQGGDQGTQYRTGIYYTTEQERTTIEAALRALQRRLNRADAGEVAVECLPLSAFYPAEDYHQDYLDKNPGGYCHISPSMIRNASSFRPDNLPAGL